MHLWFAVYVITTACIAQALANSSWGARVNGSTLPAWREEVDGGRY